MGNVAVAAINKVAAKVDFIPRCGGRAINHAEFGGPEHPSELARGQLGLGIGTLIHLLEGSRQLRIIPVDDHGQSRNAKDSTGCGRIIIRSVDNLGLDRGGGEDDLVDAILVEERRIGGKIDAIDEPKLNSEWGDSNGTVLDSSFCPSKDRVPLIGAPRATKARVELRLPPTKATAFLERSTAWTISHLAFGHLAL